MAVTPADKPKYLYLAIYDDPVAAPGDYGFHTAAWNAGRTTGALIRRVQPLQGVPPTNDARTNPFPIIARLGYGADADRVGKE
jgi:cell division protein FtsI (penicillin-binding protein 3)